MPAAARSQSRELRRPGDADLGAPRRRRDDAGPGTQHTIEAIVVGDFDGTGGLGGIFVQEQDADRDANALTSEGIFVAHVNAAPVNAGDLVRVRGTVNEDRRGPGPPEQHHDSARDRHGARGLLER